MPSAKGPSGCSWELETPPRLQARRGITHGRDSRNGARGPGGHTGAHAGGEQAPSGGGGGAQHAIGGPPGVGAPLRARPGAWGSSCLPYQARMPCSADTPALPCGRPGLGTAFKSPTPKFTKPLPAAAPAGCAGPGAAAAAAAAG